MKNSMPRFTIALPVRNGAEYLEEALDSALAQTFDDYEIMISDNASTDRTPEIIEEYKRRDSRIRSIRGSELISLSENWNRVYEHSAGEWVKILAHDDVMHSNCLARIHEEIERLPTAAQDKIALIGTGENWLFEGGISYPATSGEKGALLLRTPQFIKDVVSGKTTIPLPGATSATLHKTVIPSAHPYDKRYVRSDTPLYMRLVVDYDYLYIPEALSENRIQKSSSTYNNMRGHRAVSEERAYGRELLPYIESKVSLGLYASVRFRLRPVNHTASQISRAILCGEMVPIWGALTATPAWQMPFVLPLTLRALKRDLRKLKSIGLPARVVF